MTRENKLAMVIGFGLLLFVGILVSDHLSARNSQISNPLVATSLPQKQGLPGGVQDPPQIFGGRPESLPGGQPTDGQHAIADGSFAGNSPLGPVGGSIGGIVTPPAPVETKPSETTHVVAKGEYPSTISKRYYGTATLGEKLAKFNGVDAKGLKIGQKLRIPPVETLDPSRAPAQVAGGSGLPVGGELVPQIPAPTPTPASAAERRVRVEEGDTLYSLAKRHYGSGSRWTEIAKLNGLSERSVLREGMELRIASAQ
jgi:nucleoid-associated protein YgaU